MVLISSDEQEFREYLFRALCWLQSPQHEDAIVDHLGLYADKMFSFHGMNAVNVAVCPVVPNCGGRPSIIFNSRTVVKTDTHLYQPFNEQALMFCRALVSEFYPIYEEWNGYNPELELYLETFSICPNVFPSQGIYQARYNYSTRMKLSGYDGPGLDLLEKPLGWR